MFASACQPLANSCHYGYSLPQHVSRNMLKEFRNLPQYHCEDATVSFCSAMKPENFCKNRYPDVLPYEPTRVRLQTCPNDYINANYISETHERSYISCQAPLPQTFDDFWSMVWENNVSIVVMLTRFLERRRIKAHCYWPNEQNEVETFGNISVQLVKAKSVGPDIIIRKFAVAHAQFGEAREIVHIHYTEWPDCGVPTSTQSIRAVLVLMDAYQAKFGSDSSVVVHCSAGIGRTGTLIAIRQYLNLCKRGYLPKISDIVRDLRNQRMGMVQTREQYEFIHRVLEDIFGREQFQTQLALASVPEAAAALQSTVFKFSPNPSSKAYPDLKTTLDKSMSMGFDIRGGSKPLSKSTSSLRVTQAVV